MKALCLITHTCNCETLARSFESFDGNECRLEQYDNRSDHGELVIIAKEYEPDLIIYIGAITGVHGRPIPSVDSLRALNDVSPMVHICGDGCDRTWWPILYEYDRHQCFTVQVNIDGHFDTPIASFNNGMIRLTPLDCRVFKPRLWKDRSVLVGYNGSHGSGERAQTIVALGASTCGTVPYSAMADFMCGCKIIVNCPVNGTGDRDHIKGRVIEAGFSGSCLFERSNDITRKWFDPITDFIEFSNASDAANKLEWARSNDSEIEAIAGRFHMRMIAEHHPKVFWKDVLNKMGIVDGSSW